MNGYPVCMSEDRYHRQSLIPSIGNAGQERIGNSTVLVVGCGALGSMSADLMARAGVGCLRLVDRDVVELTNLQRQPLYDEHDVESGTPKALAAKNRLEEINSSIRIEAFVDDIDAANIEQIAEGCDLIVDGLDNFEARYLLNDLSTATNRPWIYGGAVGTTGMSAAIIPGRTPCLRCLFPEPPAPGTTPTCDTAGVLGPVVSMVAARQVLQALKILTGHGDALDLTLHSFDAWNNTRQEMKPGTPSAECPCCAHGNFEWLEGRRGQGASILCGRNAVQVKPQADSSPVPLEELAERLSHHGEFRCTDSVLHGVLLNELNDDGERIELTIFQNGRALVKGSGSIDHARAVYAKYIGS